MLAVDKIGSALNIAFSVQLIASLSEDRVLVAVESNTIITLLCVVGANGASLRTGTVGILQVDIIDLGVRSTVLKGAGCFVVWSTTRETGAVLDVYDITSV